MTRNDRACHRMMVELIDVLLSIPRQPLSQIPSIPMKYLQRLQRRWQN